jgi:hypothetical protein
MSVLNLGLQGVALARRLMDDDEFEKDFTKVQRNERVRKTAKAY